MNKYFLDTYAIVEIIRGNEKYRGFLKFELFTSIFNLYEMYYVLLRDFNDTMAKKYFFQFKRLVFQIKDEHVFLASQIKFDNKKQRLSYADCLGYSICLNEEMLFLTGDKEFKNFEQVEFVPR